MSAKRKTQKSPAVGIDKCITGITGLDEITRGGLPAGRPTLICGGPGCGKTMMAVQFLVNGALKCGEKGILMSLDETAEALAKNFISVGFDLDELRLTKKIAVDYVLIDNSQMIDTGSYSLDGLLIRLDHAISSMGAKRVVIDCIDTLFMGFGDNEFFRAELRRLFHWLKGRGVTTIVTCEAGKDSLSRKGIEEYIADCVIVLDQRIVEQISTRRLRIVKYRGSVHGADEYPFMIDQSGICVFPITSLGLDHKVSDERISTGIGELDNMMGLKGFFRGASVFVSGTAGAGKTSFAGHFIDAACRRGERAIFISFEESPDQISRNMRSIGIDLQKSLDSGTLRFRSVRPTVFGLETHLVSLLKLFEDFKPQVVVIDPISSFKSGSSFVARKALYTRLIDYLKSGQVTTLFTDLISNSQEGEHTDEGVSSLMDTWILLTNIYIQGERKRSFKILKSRGMGHSNQSREYVITDRGIQFLDFIKG